MDYKETQVQELEALEAIYPGEMEIVSDEYPNIAVKISLCSHERKETPHAFQVTLSLWLSVDYPDAIPKIEVTGIESKFSDERIGKVQKMLTNVAIENLGMPMIFTIVSALQDEIGHLIEELKAEEIEAEQLAIQKKEAQEQKKFEGTRVTPEVFLAWKINFDTEMQAIKKKENLASFIRESQISGKLTGRQLFLRDATLNLSDVALMEAAGTEIGFDESLFQEDVGDLNSDISDGEDQ
ncbi:unnamed protein product [Thelazia callipaeda]|uniref:RWD domain-containing protein n=1 Tax=Thelazia callipaeda TaxID=103827 RepID=A0A0N5CW20_THECL|nr:unnamed protein product [Thelazia callipaeda]